MKGKVSISPNFRAVMRKITSARFARWISGWVNRGRARKSASSYRRMQTPPDRRPQRPLRCSALLCEIASMGKRWVCVRGL